MLLDIMIPTVGFRSSSTKDERTPVLQSLWHLNSLLRKIPRTVEPRAGYSSMGVFCIHFCYHAAARIAADNNATFLRRREAEIEEKRLRTR